MQLINIKSYFRGITVDPVNLSISRKLLSALSSFIVNNENRLVGMVYQANLIDALYNVNINSIQNGPV